MVNATLDNCVEIFEDLEPEDNIFPASLGHINRFVFNANYRHLLYKNGYILAATSDNQQRMLTVLDSDGAYVTALLKTGKDALQSLGSYWSVIDEETDILYLGMRRVATAEAAPGTPMSAIVAVNIADITNPQYSGDYIWVYESSVDPDLAIPLVTAIDLFSVSGRKYLAVAGNSSTAGGGPNVGQAGFCIMDVTDPENMQVVDYHAQREDTQCLPHGVQVLDNRWAVTANYNAGQKPLQLWDVGNPDNALLTGFAKPVHTGGFPWGVAKYPGNSSLVGVASSSTSKAAKEGTAFLGMIMADISDPQNMRIISEGKIPDDKIETRDIPDMPPNFLYFCQKAGKVWGLLPGGEHALHVFDCTDPYNIVFSHNAELPDGQGMVVSRSCVVYEVDGEYRIAFGDGAGVSPGGKGITVAKILWEPEISKIYIDPSQLDDGTGTKESPRNTWKNVVKNGVSAAYLQLAGTEYKIENLRSIIPYQFSPPADAPIYFGAYGTGKKPIIKSENKGNIFYFQNTNITGGCTIENLVIDSADANGVRMDNGGIIENVKISKCDFITRIIESSTGVYSSVLYYQNNADFRNNSVEHCSFTSDKQHSADTVFIRIYQKHEEENPKELSDFLIRDNTFNAIDGYAIRIFPDLPRDESGQFVGDLSLWRPVGLRVINNIFNDCVSPVALHTGSQSTTRHKSEFIGNTFFNSGRWDKANINALQLNYVDDVEIAYNTFENVYTSLPDGDAIILDWALSDENYISTNCLVHHNRISGCNSARAVSPTGTGSAGISLFRAKDCLVYSNWIHYCNSGIGVSGAPNNKSLNNKVFNNSVMNCLLGIRCAVNTDGTSFENNLVMFCETGIYLNMPAASPVTLRNNLLHNNSKSLVDVYGGDAHYVQDGPNGNTNNIIVEYPYDREKGYILQEHSPAIRAGVEIPGDERIDESCFGINGAPVSSPPAIGAWQPEMLITRLAWFTDSIGKQVINSAYSDITINDNTASGNTGISWGAGVYLAVNGFASPQSNGFARTLQAAASGGTLDIQKETPFSSDTSPVDGYGIKTSYATQFSGGWMGVGAALSGKCPYISVYSVNLGMAAWQALPRLEAEILPTNPSHVALHFGTNDVEASRSSAAIASSLKTLCRRIHETGAKVYLFSLPPGHKSTGEEQARTRKEVNSTMREWARTRQDVFYVDTYSHLADEDGYLPDEYAQQDGSGVHITDAGYYAGVAPWRSFLEKYAAHYPAGENRLTNAAFTNTTAATVSGGTVSVSGVKPSGSLIYVADAVTSGAVSSSVVDGVWEVTASGLISGQYLALRPGGNLEPTGAETSIDTWEYASVEAQLITPGLSVQALNIYSYDGSDGSFSGKYISSWAIHNDEWHTLGGRPQKLLTGHTLKGQIAIYVYASEAFTAETPGTIKIRVRNPKLWGVSVIE